MRYLKRYEQHWPEWERLRIFLNQTDFSAHRSPDSGDLYLMCSRRLPGNRRLLLNATLLDDDGENLEEEGLPSLFPGFIHLLYDMKAVPYSENVDAMIRYRGGIGALAGPLTAIQYYRSDPARFLRSTGVPDDRDESEIPENLFLFQSSSSGRLFFLNEKRRVVLYSPERDRFSPVGGIETFTRFCVDFILDGRDWYEDGYKINYNLDYFDLDFID